MQRRLILAAVLLLAPTTTASDPVVIDMPAPKGTTFEQANAAEPPSIGKVALHRYAWGRTGPRYTSAAPAGPWGGFRGYRYGIGFGFVPFYPVHGYGFWGHPFGGGWAQPVGSWNRFGLRRR